MQSERLGGGCQRDCRGHRRPIEAMLLPIRLISCRVDAVIVRTARSHLARPTCMLCSGWGRMPRTPGEHAARARCGPTILQTCVRRTELRARARALQQGVASCKLQLANTERRDRSEGRWAHIQLCDICRDTTGGGWSRHAWLFKRCRHQPAEGGRIPAGCVRV